MAISAVGGDRTRTAELMAATCLATDLGMGFPFEHGLHATLMAMRLADLVDVDRDTSSQIYYASLLMYSGCTVDAEVSAAIFGADMTPNIVPRQFGSATEALGGVIRALADQGTSVPRRVVQIASRLPEAGAHRKPHFAAMCEVAAMFAARFGLPTAIQGLFPLLTERWDGKGVLKRAKEVQIPLPIRIVHIARDAAFQRLIGGNEYAVSTVRERAGHSFDPEIARVFIDNSDSVLSAADVAESAWEPTLAAEPRPWLELEGDGIDRALAALGEFADLVSPFFTGHSNGVAALAVAAAGLCGLGGEEVASTRRAALVHDVGRVAVHPRVWQKIGPLSADEWEQVRLHAYHTERVFSRSPFLATLGTVASAHHERLDGTGYHRHATAPSLPPPARLLAAADAFQAMTEPRPHRDPLTPLTAGTLLGEQARLGRLDAEMVAAVLEAAGQPRPQIDRPAGLTEREAEVIGLLARGLQTKQVARALDISAKTADHHIQNAYRKIGVSTRAGATLFATEHGLVPWGELPMVKWAYHP